LTWYVNIKDCKNVPSFTGETSIGKSTLMNTLFNTTFESEEARHISLLLLLEAVKRLKLGGGKWQYPWGVVQVENESHCDFVKLREMLIHVNMLDLREQTHARHCELYRRCKLEEMGFKDTDPDSEPFKYCNTLPQLMNVLLVLSYVLTHSLQETYVAKRRGFIGELQLKEEQRRQMFVSKVKETEAELKENRREVRITGFDIIFGIDKIIFVQALI
ncbi:hypothetical protein cypCar_00008632, partial [Cyprinus carpio]